MTPEERKAAYENSALRVLMESTGHEICPRCYCCDLVSETETCWQCGGFEDEGDWDWPPDVCSVCNGEGELSYKVCIGGCDENGNHKLAERALSEAGAKEGKNNG